MPKLRKKCLRLLYTTERKEHSTKNLLAVVLNANDKTSHLLWINIINVLAVLIYYKLQHHCCNMESLLDSHWNAIFQNQMAKANYPEQNTATGVYEFLEDVSVNTVLFFFSTFYVDFAWATCFSYFGLILRKPIKILVTTFCFHWFCTSCHAVINLWCNCNKK